MAAEVSAMLPNIHQNKVDLQSDASASQALLRTWHRSHSVSLSTVSNATKFAFGCSMAAKFTFGWSIVVEGDSCFPLSLWLYSSGLC